MRPELRQYSAAELYSAAIEKALEESGAMGSSHSVVLQDGSSLEYFDGQLRVVPPSTDRIG